MYAVEVKNLSKSFGDLKAVNDISFNVSEGSVFGLLGRNGAGKTTTIRMMMNIYEPDKGEVLIRGVKMGQDFRNQVGYLPEERGLYKKMKVLDTILYFAELKGKRNKETEKRAQRYLEMFQLADRKNSKIEELSKGNQQKVQFILTVLHEPEFIILDEPFSGLDPVNTDLLIDLILELKNKGKIIILCTHLMDFAERMCDHIVLIDNGEKILDGALRDIKEKHSEGNIFLEYKGNISFIKDLNFVEKFEDFGNTANIKVSGNDKIQTILKLALDNNVEINKFNANDISLHEIFVSLTGYDEKSKRRMLNV
ncbi:MAG TPA: ATP-binding cassette domain-containing protein [Ignavibacteriaceae bacterium]|nr:ATP-binding cassette domain-containing protein [Ignavibacteriaceae bacterium]